MVKVRILIFSVRSAQVVLDRWLCLRGGVDSVPEFDFNIHRVDRVVGEQVQGVKVVDISAVLHVCDLLQVHCPEVGVVLVLFTLNYISKPRKVVGGLPVVDAEAIDGVELTEVVDVP